MTTEIHFLMVHGVGYAGPDAAWADNWKDAISKAIQRQGIDIAIRFSAVGYDALFERSKIGNKAVVEAMRRLTTGGLSHDIDDPSMHRRSPDDTMRRTAGMIAQWAVDETLRSETCDLIRQAIKLNDPGVICAHSLGSLIAYDLFAREGAAVRDRTFISFGSQIGHPFLRSLFGGRITPLPSAVRWYHLYNREDSVFSAPIRLSAANFEQVDMPFAISGKPNHDPGAYLSHPGAFEHVWKPMCGAETKMAVRAKGLWRSSRAKPERRALLVGINEYPNPADRLEGCVNDVFRMSEVLQEGGVKPENIRVVLNHRATAEGIRDRLEWLLDGTGPDAIRIFYYSGHGAQIPNYGEEDEIDHSARRRVIRGVHLQPDGGSASATGEKQAHHV